MKFEQGRLIIGSIIGFIIGAIIAYLVWGFSAPGGIIMIFGFGIGGMIGWSTTKKKISKNNE